MNNTNDVQMPDSLIVAQAQNSLKQLLQAFPLPAYAWRLIVKDLMHEINDAYMAQLASDQEEYQRRIAEVSAPEKTEEERSKRK